MPLTHYRTIKHSKEIMAFGHDSLLSNGFAWLWLALLIVLFFRIEKPAKHYFKQGLKAMVDDSPNLAITYFKSALIKKSDYPEARAALSQLYVNRGDARSAECLVEQNIQQGFDLENSVLLLAQIYFYQNKINQLDEFVQSWQNHIDLSVAVREKLKLYTTLILVHRRALPSPTLADQPKVFNSNGEI